MSDVCFKFDGTENNSNSTVNVYTVFLDVTGYNWNN